MKFLLWVFWVTPVYFSALPSYLSQFMASGNLTQSPSCKVSLQKEWKIGVSFLSQKC